MDITEPATPPAAPASPGESETYTGGLEPDTKDWTWVLREACPECGLVAGEVDPRTIPDLIPAQIAFWRRVLVDRRCRERPAAGVWSPLEYACHVRDVYDVFGTRVELLRDEVDPTFANWDQDEAAVAGRYHEQQPLVVADELTERALARAAFVGTLPEEAGERSGERCHGSAFTTATLLQYVLHDVVKHVHDVRAHLGDV